MSRTPLLLLLVVLLQGPLASLQTQGTTQYYRCYFDKYFRLGEEEHLEDRQAFVQRKVAEHQRRGEGEPSSACVRWMCDSAMVWSWKLEDKLETWTFYSDPGTKVEAWGQCFDDQVEDFRRKNYTFSDAGEGFSCHNC